MMGAGRAQPQLHHYKQHWSSDARSIQAFSARTACFEVVQKVKNQVLTNFPCLPFTITLETTHPLQCSFTEKPLLHSMQRPFQSQSHLQTSFRATHLCSYQHFSLCSSTSCHTSPFSTRICSVIKSSYTSTLCRSLQNKRES